MSMSPDLHKGVLAGVARAPLGAASAPLQDVLAGASGPLRLWHLIAAEDLYERAGFTPPPAASTAPAACAAAPVSPRAAERVLDQILRGIHPEQLGAWLALARLHGTVLPHAALVPLLELGTHKPALRVDLTPVLGQRGRWLAAQHPVWRDQYGASADPATHWQTGTLAQRTEALQADWPQAPPEQRAALLPVLLTGLGPADEAFLEAALDDKRKEVRTAAQQLLVAMPGAQLVERCKARLAALLTIERKSGLVARLGAMLGGGAVELAVTLPAACDKAMQRDGIGAETHRGIGEKAGWLLDLVRSVPPWHWSASWQLAPADVLDLFAKQEFNTALVSGLAQACVRTLPAVPDQEAIAWFEVLLGAEPATLLPALHRLPAAEQERIVLAGLAASASDMRALAWAEQRFSGATDALSPVLSQQLLASAQRGMRAITQPRYEDRRRFAILGSAMDPAVLAAAPAGWPAPDWDGWPHWRDTVDTLMDTLQFRKTMHAGFLETEA